MTKATEDDLVIKRAIKLGKTANQLALLRTPPKINYSTNLRMVSTRFTRYESVIKAVKGLCVFRGV